MQKISHWLISFLLYAGNEKEEFYDTYNRFAYQNRKTLIEFSLIASILAAASFVISFFQPHAMLNRMAYLILFAVNLFLFLFSFLKKNPSPSCIACLTILFQLIIYAFGIFIGTITNTNNYAISFTVILVFIPLVYNQRPISTIGTMLLAIAAFGLFGYTYKEYDIFTLDMMNITLFSIVSFFISIRNFKIRFENMRLLKEQTKLMQKAESLSNAKSDFLANVSHELRTPINAVLGMDEMILRETSEPNTKKYASAIKSASETVLAIIGNILDFSRFESGKMKLIPTEYNFRDFLNEVLMLHFLRIKTKGLELKTNIDSNIPRMMYGDDLRIKQILSNLLSNAVKYTQQGSITVSAICTRRSDDKAIIHFSVKDTGIGVRPEDKEILFDKFSRLEQRKNRNIEGTGLGLSIVHKALELFNSSLNVNSIYGVGSDFSFDLEQTIVDSTPVGFFDEIYSAKSQGKDSYKQTLYAPSAEILSVDDNEMNLLVFSGLLKNTGVKVTSVKNGTDALVFLRTKKFDIAFIDHFMPGKNGIEILHEFKSQPGTQNDNIPFIALTANTISGARDMYLENGFTDFISKPINYIELENILYKYLPRELVSKRNIDASPVQNVDSSIQQEVEENFVIDHTASMIEWAKGLALCSDDKKLYEKILAKFVEASEKDHLTALYEAGDWDNYLITIHALKSNLNNIGALSTASKAKQIEISLREGDSTFAKENHASFLKEYEKILETVRLRLNA